MYLQLTGVKTVTEARFAAGEGFTHVCLDGSLASPDMAAQRQAIREAMSGVQLGLPIWAGGVSELGSLPEGIDYLWAYAPVKDGTIGQGGSVLKTSSSNVETGKGILHGLTTVDEWQALMATGHAIEGLSFQSPGEDRPGWIAEAPFIDLLEYLDEVGARPGL